MERICFGTNSDNQKLYLIIYDISDDKRRHKIARVLAGFGKRVQMSAFECWLNKRNYKRLNDKLLKYIYEDDNLRVYALSQGPVNEKGTEYEVENCSNLYVC